MIKLFGVWFSSFLTFLGLMFAMAGSAHAALATEITSAITTTQTDVLALLAALTVAGAAIWVGRIIYRYFTVR